MIELRVKGIRGIPVTDGDEYAVQMAYGALTKIVGANCSGKTSRVAALAALLSRNPDPLGYGIQQQKRYINNETEPDEAQATLTEYDGVTAIWRLTWEVSKGSFDEFGYPPDPLPPLIANTVLVSQETLKKEFIDAMFVGSISKAELVDRISQIFSEVPEVATAASLADQILGGQHGWTEVFNIAKERGLVCKRSWDEIVAQDGKKVFYGDIVGRNWRPTRWTPELESTTPESIERKLFDLRSALEHAEDKVRELKNTQERLMEHRDHVEKIESMRKEIEQISQDVGVGMKRPASFEVPQEMHDKVGRLSKKIEGGQLLLQEGKSTLAIMKKDEREAMADFDLICEKIRVNDEERKKQNELNEELVKKLEAPQVEGKAVCEECGQELPGGESPKAKRKREARVEVLKHQLLETRLLRSDEEMELHKRRDEQNDLLARIRDSQSAVMVKNDEIEHHLQGNTAELNSAKAEIRAYEDKAAALEQEVKSADADRAKKMQRADLLRVTLLALTEEIAEEVKAPTDYDVEMANRKVDTILAEIREHEHAIRMINWVRDASAAHRMVQAWGRIRDFVGPDGIRKEKIEEGTKTLNGWIEWLQQGIALENPISFRGGKLMVGPAPVKVASGSEQWLASAILRIAMAVMNGGKVIAIDGADVLDSMLRPRAYTMLKAVAEHAKVAILVTETGQ